MERFREILSKTHWTIWAAVVAVVLIALTGGTIHAGTFDFNFPGVQWRINKATSSAPIDTPHFSDLAASQATASSALSSVVSAGASMTTIATGPDLSVPSLPLSPAASVLLIPLGSSESDVARLLGGTPPSWQRAEGGKVLAFEQQAFGRWWEVAERFVNAKAVSATLTFSESAHRNIEAGDEPIGKDFSLVHSLCYGSAFQAMKNEWDINMQLVRQRFDAQPIDTTAGLDTATIPICASTDICRSAQWSLQHGDWVYQVPGLWYVYVSMVKSELEDPVRRDEEYKPLFRRDRCAAKITYLLDSSSPPSQVSILP
jgi:hypothetical protein